MLFAALDEAEKVGTAGPAVHHAQQGVLLTPTFYRPRPTGSTRWSIGTVCTEAMFTDRAIQALPGNGIVNNDEQMRFGEAGDLWQSGGRSRVPRRGTR